MGARGILRTMGDELVGFWCPGCEAMHIINTDISDRPQFAAWEFDGNYDAPTFSPSIHVNPGRVVPHMHVCHSFVRGGRIEFLGDCTHALAGQTVELQKHPHLE